MVKIDFEEIEKDVLDILKRYIAIPSYTNTKSERLVEQFLMSYCKTQPYY